MRIVTEEGLSAALSALPSTPRVVVPGNAGLPATLLRLVDAAVPAYRLFALNAPAGLPDRDGVSFETPFVGPGMRDSPRLSYLPARLSLVPTLYRRSLPPDVVLLHTSLPYSGTLSMGIEVNILPAAVEAVRARGGLVIAQINPRMPYTYGDGVLTPDDIDLAIEVDEPLPKARPPAGDDLAGAIGERVAALVADGSTLQLGIGGVPDATLTSLRGRRHLRIWSEMASDHLLDLEREGALDPDATITVSFLVGSAELYDWADRHPRLRLLRTERTNDPSVIARQNAMTSINTALQVDLLAQANASRRPGKLGRVYSGLGGQTDFVVGALHSHGGQAIVALPSWHPGAGVSTVVPLVSAVTSFQHSHIVSEQGDARLWGHDAEDQTRQLIERVAHPRARAELVEAAGTMGLLR